MVLRRQTPPFCMSRSVHRNISLPRPKKGDKFKQVNITVPLIYALVFHSTANQREMQQFVVRHRTAGHSKRKRINKTKKAQKRLTKILILTRAIVCGSQFSSGSRILQTARSESSVKTPVGGSSLNCTWTTSLSEIKTYHTKKLF